MILIGIGISFLIIQTISIGAQWMIRVPTIHARDPNEQHRASSTLKLWFDLVYVIAVAVAVALLLQAGFITAYLSMTFLDF